MNIPGDNQNSIHSRLREDRMVYGYIPPMHKQRKSENQAAGISHSTHAQSVRARSRSSSKNRRSSALLSMPNPSRVHKKSSEKPRVWQPAMKIYYSRPTHRS